VPAPGTRTSVSPAAPAQLFSHRAFLREGIRAQRGDFIAQHRILSFERADPLFRLRDFVTQPKPRGEAALGTSHA